MRREGVGALGLLSLIMDKEHFNQAQSGYYGSSKGCSKAPCPLKGSEVKSLSHV